MALNCCNADEAILLHHAEVDLVQVLANHDVDLDLAATGLLTARGCPSIFPMPLILPLSFEPRPIHKLIGRHWGDALKG